VVLLTGQAETIEYRNQFVTLARNTPMVKQVISEVEIGPTTGWTETSKDAYITSKVKLALFEIEIEGFDPSRVKVVTEKRVVYLMGLVRPEEAQEVVEKARYVPNVARVVKAFEYLR
jgi:osmotically-inducible protein OsmY